MAKRGERKYRCGECGCESLHHWIERTRAGRLRCPRCGSARMELCGNDAKREVVDLQTIRIAGGTRSTTPPNPHDTPYRKIT